MTQGNPLKLILKFALPLLLGNLLQQTYNVVDAAIVGRILGAGALAGVGASTSVQFLILGFCIGTCSGFGIPIAQRFGAQDHKHMKDYLFHGYILSAVMALILTLSCCIFCSNILHMLKTPEEIFQDAHTYLMIIFIGIPATVLYNLLSGYLRAIGDSKTPFVFLAISTVLNIGLDFVCIAVFHWGVAGAAIATVFSQLLSGLLCLFVILYKSDILHIGRDNCHFRNKDANAMLMMGIPMGLQFSITAIGSMFMQSANNGLGSIYVSGFTAGTRIKQFVMCPFDAIATAVSVYCGQNYGAGFYDRIKRGIRTGFAINIAYGIVAGVALILGGRTMAMLFMDAGETAILDAAAKYLACLGTCYWILGCLAIYRLSVQGLGFSGRAIFSGVSEMIARICVSVIFVPLVGFNAICWADQTAWIAACCYLTPTLLTCLKKVKVALGYTQADNA
ncbi:MAG: MATE family efflux transporter [Lachnospiraceae bacterium]|nr:MATE family efflux transporter [Lachnospiraceae bacterium]